MSTIKEVAKLAGVSPSTVSRTLSNRIFVEEETRQKVLKAVEELNYRPSIMAKALREGRTYTIALLVPDINSLYYPMIMKSVEKYATQNGYSIILCNNNESIECEKRNLEMLGSRGIDGILCMSIEDDIRHLLCFQKEKKVPIVLINRDFTEDISCISVDNEYGGYLMVKYLLDMGHRKIAGMFGDFSRQRFRERYNGCKRAMEEYGVENYKKYFIYDVNTIEEAYRCAQEVMLREDRPTAFFASLDILAIGIYSGISENGFTIPGDVSVAGFDNIFMTEYMIPPLTTYNAPIDRLAEESVRCLIHQIEDGAAASRILMKGELIERKSVCAVR